MTLATRSLTRPSRFEAEQLTEWRPRGVRDEHGQQLAEAMEQARQAGLAAARAEVDAAVAAHDAARRDLSSAASALARAVDHLVARDQDDLQDIERQAVRFAVDVAESLVGRELTTVDAALEAALGRAAGLTSDRGPVVVRVHPDDAAATRATLADCTELAGRAEIVEDRTVERGGCATEVGALRIDAQLGDALERVRRVVNG